MSGSRGCGREFETQEKSFWCSILCPTGMFNNEPLLKIHSHTNPTLIFLRGHNERSNLVNRTADDVGNSPGIACSAGWLFPDQSGLQYGRRCQYHGSSTVEPLGDFYSSRARLLDR